MASESPTRLAREAKEAGELLKQEHEFLLSRFDDLDLLGLRERVARIEERLLRVEKTQEDIKEVPVLADRINKLEKHKEETEKRGWQFVFIGAGAGLALIGGIVVQLVAFIIKK
jgi:hypothetical protein